MTATTPNASPSQPDGSPASGRTIVLVEDPAGSQLALALTLAQAGWRVVRMPVEDAGANLESLRHVVAVIVELRLEQPTGLALAQQIRRAFDEHRPLLLSISTLGHPGFFDLSRQGEFDAHVVKPVPLNRVFGLLGLA